MLSSKKWIESKLPNIEWFNTGSQHCCYYKCTSVFCVCVCVHTCTCVYTVYNSVKWGKISVDWQQMKISVTSIVWLFVEIGALKYDFENRLHIAAVLSLL